MMFRKDYGLRLVKSLLLGFLKFYDEDFDYCRNKGRQLDKGYEFCLGNGYEIGKWLRGESMVDQVQVVSKYLLDVLVYY